MTTVRPFEADLLHLLHAILGGGPKERAISILLARRPRPECLGRPALGLIRAALAGGTARRLARLGGWLPGRHLRGDRVASGRLWERTPPEALGLPFSGRTLDFLIRLVADEPAGWPPWPGGGTLGDRVLLFFAYQTFRETPACYSWRKDTLFTAHAFCRLAHPADFAGTPGLDPAIFAPWSEPDESWILEVLQGSLASSWVEAGRSKAGSDSPESVLAIGEEEARVAEAFLSAVEAAGRRDLARFFLEVARELLASESSLTDWIRSPALEGLSLERRARVARASLAPLATLDRLRGWEHQARGVGYFDEGYVAAQLFKSDWEAAGGEELWPRARSLLRSADPLAPL